MTHFIGAKPSDLKVHRDGPPDQDLNLSVCGTTVYSTICHNYCQTRMRFSYFIYNHTPHSTVPWTHAKVIFNLTHYHHFPCPVDFFATCPLFFLLFGNGFPPLCGYKNKKHTYHCYRPYTYSELCTNSILVLHFTHLLISIGWSSLKRKQNKRTSIVSHH